MIKSKAGCVASAFGEVDADAPHRVRDDQYHRKEHEQERLVICDQSIIAAAGRIAGCVLVSCTEIRPNVLLVRSADLKSPEPSFWRR